MKPQPATLIAWTLALILAGTCLAATEPVNFYLDDNRDLVDLDLEAKAAGAPDLEPLAVGLEPLSIEPARFEPDDLRSASLKDAPSNDGTGPLVNSNYIRLTISAAHVNADSETDYIYARFGERSGNDDGSSPYQLRLWGLRVGSDYRFPAGATITWDLSGLVAFFEAMPQHHWDQLSFVTPSGDGMLLARVEVVHSGQEIVDWSVNRWLDAPNHTSLGCAAKMAERKLAHVGATDHSAIYFAAMDIGKTNGYKYGTGRLWCSEFASWALKKEGFMTPSGNFGTVEMKDWFRARGRLYTRDQVKAKTYVPAQGDYISINDGGHSVLFLRWVDSTDTITDTTRFKTIEGNSSDTVRVVTRRVSCIDRVGKAQ